MNIYYTATLSIGIFSILILIIYYFYYFRKLATYKTITLNGFQPPLSVIICARNEKDKLANYLPIVLNQDYPNYEVVLMNDCSWDGTKDFLKEFALDYPKLKVHHLEEENLYKHDKKFPLTLAIKAAENEILVFTDADCYPKTKNWLTHMVNQFQSQQTELIVGYGAYQKQSGVLNKLIRFDTFISALLYFSRGINGNLYMGTGRNMAYLRSLFFKNKGFASHNHISSGDDDLFINRVVTKTNFKVQVNSESHTVSVPKTNIIAWFNQKRRHVTTSKYYKLSSKFYLSSYFGALALFYISVIGLFFMSSKLIYVPIALLLVKTLIQLISFSKNLSKLDEKDLLFWTPFCEVFLLMFFACVQFVNLFVKQPKWK